MELIEWRDWYDRPVLGICEHKGKYYFFVLIENDGTDIFAFTYLTKQTEQELISGAKDMYTIMSENTCYKGTWNSEIKECILNDDQKPNKGQYY